MSDEGKRKNIHLDVTCPEAGDLLPDEVRLPGEVRPAVWPRRQGEQGSALCDGEGGAPEKSSKDGEWKR